MRKKIEKRGRKLIDFDKERHNVQTLQGNPNRNEAKYARYFYAYSFFQISSEFQKDGGLFLKTNYTITHLVYLLTMMV